ncbi:hypothetical protein L596_016967 [Steinernema carpocapsae]|uniref:Uncharacterized protein n=1 Tax=Steinernema carpocapsae TaxID=34508 RepID=A0A4U5N0G3_STECR|nr:hypothetical protein L596_016967 [Steinernema carpocapsae]
MSRNEQTWIFPKRLVSPFFRPSQSLPLPLSQNRKKKRTASTTSRITTVSFSAGNILCSKASRRSSSSTKLHLSYLVTLPYKEKIKALQLSAIKDNEDYFDYFAPKIARISAFCEVLVIRISVQRRPEIWCTDSSDFGRKCKRKQIVDPF